MVDDLATGIEWSFLVQSSSRHSLQLMENTEGEGNPLDVLAPGKRKVLHIQVGLAAGHTVGNNGSSFS